MGPLALLAWMDVEKLICGWKQAREKENEKMWKKRGKFAAMMEKISECAGCSNNTETYIRNTYIPSSRGIMWGWRSGEWWDGYHHGYWKRRKWELKGVVYEACLSEWLSSTVQQSIMSFCLPFFENLRALKKLLYDGGELTLEIIIKF